MQRAGVGNMAADRPQRTWGMPGCTSGSGYSDEETHGAKDADQRAVLERHTCIPPVMVCALESAFLRENGSARTLFPMQLVHKKEAAV